MFLVVKVSVMSHNGEGELIEGDVEGSKNIFGDTQGGVE
jgi:hypothetical protein